MHTVTAHGAAIPVVGFGTWRLSGETCARAVAEALRVGYRHIDGAAGYGNEDRVGEGIRASGVPRDEIFVTTKVPPEHLDDRAFQRSVDRSLEQLGLDQVDLVLIHWPSRTLPVATTIASLNKARARGATRHIGVSNFTIALLREAWAATDAPLVTNQCEYHPYLAQDRLIAACREWGMAFTAFSPLGREAVLDDPVIAEIAARKGKTPAQIVLRWDIQQPGIVTIPKSARPDRIRSNLDIFDFSLSDSEMAAISHLGRSHRHRVADPSIAPAWDE
ncbi:MAG TPA: aldo/keto reductase [Bauldia sp.]|nr:aldo/keto reductase [Bauldia sp.]